MEKNIHSRRSKIEVSEKNLTLTVNFYYGGKCLLGEYYSLTLQPVVQFLPFAIHQL